MFGHAVGERELKVHKLCVRELAAHDRWEERIAGRIVVALRGPEL